MPTNALQVGFSEVDITPAGSVLLAGYYFDRQSTGIHDRLYARSMAVCDGRERGVLCVCDLIQLPGTIVPETRRLVQEQTGLRPEKLILSSVHSHTAPDLRREHAYAAAIPALLAESVRRALEDLAPREVKVARGQETTLQFIRRFRMKDGTVRTNPGVGNPDVAAPIGTIDPDVHALLAFDGARARGGLAHFALHCDTVGGTEISADWTHYLRERVREKFGRDLCLLTPIGPCGDINHWNVFKPVSLRGFAETERIGNRLALSVLQALEQPRAVTPGTVQGLAQSIVAKTRAVGPAELEEAKNIYARPGPAGVDFTMDRVEAARKIRATELGPTVQLDITVLAFGNVAVVGVPTEYFTELGRRIKRQSPFEYTLVTTLANGNVGYIGEQQNYEEGGYEMTSSVVAPGTGEQIAAAAVELLRKAGDGRS